MECYQNMADTENLDVDFSAYTVIDIETPNIKNDSICSIAYMYVVDGIVKSKACYLVNPVTKFDDINIRIHGITPKLVEDKPTFDVIWEKIKRYIDGKIIVAHNAIFDLTVLCKTLNRYSIKVPDYFYYFFFFFLAKNIIYKSLDTQKNVLSLDTLCKQFNITLEHHHDALYDVIACDELFSKLFEIYTFDPQKTIKKYTPHIHKKADYKGILISMNDEDDNIEETLTFDTSCDVIIKNSAFCFSGNFLYQTKEALEQKIISLGGIYKNGVSKKVDYVVVGSAGNDKWKYGNYGSKIMKALSLKKEGHNIKIITEKYFLQYLN